MKKHITVALSFIAILTGIPIIGCSPNQSRVNNETTRSENDKIDATRSENDKIDATRSENDKINATRSEGDTLSGVPNPEPSKNQCQIGNEATCSEGDQIIFGTYNSSPIEWYVLKNDTSNHRLMLVAMDVLKLRPEQDLRYGIESEDIKPEYREYNTESEDITWEQSTIRSWLNGYGPSVNKQREDYTSNNFITNAFTSEERARIPKVTVVNEDSPDQHPDGDRTPGGSNTQDYIFFLSINEVKTFLKNKRLCREQIYCLDPSTTSWLRSPGYLANQAAILKVDESTPDTYGMLVTSPQGVRPALWLNY